MTTTTVRAEDATRGELRRPLPREHRHLRRLTAPARLPGSHDCRKARLRNWTRPCCENCSKTTRQHTPETVVRSRALANGPANQRETGNRAGNRCAQLGGQEWVQPTVPTYGLESSLRLPGCPPARRTLAKEQMGPMLSPKES